ncbi:hypothetical protein FDZ71_06240 [bacterium]|nr:MAG: hypothetical protein FDZ71_06240 [bacterium]
MKIEARLFYDVLKTYNKITASDVKAFMTGKDYEVIKADLKTQISTMQDGKATVFMRTTNTKTKIIMKEVVNQEDVDEKINDWVDNKAYQKLMDDCLQYVYDKLSGATV